MSVVLEEKKEKDLEKSKFVFVGVVNFSGSRLSLLNKGLREGVCKSV